ncbi:MAG TPA: CpsD/CapB family tyrosine-protein kinase, partial [Variovorax sp.]|nr:CpsD/CapB family tyrosine-protein kinase [Variovorax sp.]
REDIRKKLSLPCIGVVPRTPAKDAFVEDLKNPASVVSEAYSAIVAALRFSTEAGMPKMLLVTSTRSGEGKSSSTLALAQNFARRGKRVLLIDADLRRSSLAAVFGLKRRGGLSELIQGSIEFQNAVHTDVLGHLDVMTTGALPTDPSALLTSDAFARVLEKASARYDLVIVDTPPMLLASETAELAPWMGTLLMVARAGDNELGDLSESANQLRLAGAQFQGVVLNAMDTSRRYYGKLAYRYGGYQPRVHEYPSAVAELPQPARASAAS